MSPFHERTASQIKAEPVPEVHQAYRNCFGRMKKQLIADYGEDYTSKLPQKMTRK